MSIEPQEPGAAAPGGPFHALLQPICRVFEALAMLMLVLVTSAIMIEVVARGVFALGLPGVGEIARFAGLALIFLTVPVLLARDAHVKVDMFSAKAQGLGKRVLEFLNEGATLCFCVLFLVATWWFMQRAARFSTPALGIPNLVYYSPAILGMALTTLVAFDRVLAVWLRGRGVSPRPPAC